MRLFIAALFLFLPVSAFCAESVFVLANKNVKESADLAAQYCALRGIGQENLILLDVKNAPNISRADYRLRVASPVFETLKARGMFSASGVYPKVSVFANRAKYVVLCKGLPYRILEDAPAGAPKPDAHSNNSACLDSELALLLEGDYSLSNFRLNKSFKAGVYSPMLNQLIVARLDGITYADALNLVKSAIYAEQNGLRGRVYIDKSKKYPAGDEWLSAAEKILSDKGFDITTDEKPACMDYFFRFDAPVFYLGWYASSPVYYFKSDLVKFAPGASALHIYSFAASNLASKKTWAPNLVSHAPAAAFGYTDEPFLIGTHRPDIYVAALASGKTAGESAFLAMFAFSWKGMFLGDPLYRPFSVPLERQLKFIEGGKVDGFSQYAVIRAMNLASDSSEAVQIGL
ncbi:MAG: TIGR03790 family protein, partial [Opitutales bacterium]|nr:TIGR03790 family protein [Opitutales bacterium]